MNDKDIRPPKWGPTTDPAPWGPTTWVDPIPWWWHRVPFPHPGDPIWLGRFAEEIKPEVLVELRRLEIAAARVQIEVQAEFMKAQGKAQLDLMEQQLDILKRSF